MKAVAIPSISTCLLRGDCASLGSQWMMHDMMIYIYFPPLPANALTN